MSKRKRSDSNPKGPEPGTLLQENGGVGSSTRFASVGVSTPLVLKGLAAGSLTAGEVLADGTLEVRITERAAVVDEAQALTSKREAVLLAGGRALAMVRVCGSAGGAGNVSSAACEPHCREGSGGECEAAQVVSPHLRVE